MYKPQSCGHPCSTLRLSYREGIFCVDLGLLPHPHVEPGRAVIEARRVCPQNDEEAMVEAVALYNPVSFAFEVTDDFMLYRSGIYSR